MSQQLQFEIFSAKATRSGKGTGAYVTAQRGGIYSLSQDAYDALGNAEAVELLYDRHQRVMGFRPVSSDVPHAYRLRKQAKAAAYLVSGRAFNQFYGVKIEKATRYPATMQDGVLVVDLNAQPAGR